MNSISNSDSDNQPSSQSNYGTETVAATVGHDKVRQVLLTLCNEDIKPHYEFSWDCNYCLLSLAPKEVEWRLCWIAFWSISSQTMVNSSCLAASQDYWQQVFLSCCKSRLMTASFYSYPLFGLICSSIFKENFLF